MPIEDASVEWNERDVALRSARAHPHSRSRRWTVPEMEIRCESTAFNPWHALAAHSPLGNMNRARKEIYKALAAFRAQRAPAQTG